jgi:hypothetical protein
MKFSVILAIYMSPYLITCTPCPFSTIFLLSALHYFLLLSRLWQCKKGRCFACPGGKNTLTGVFLDPLYHILHTCRRGLPFFFSLLKWFQAHGPFNPSPLWLDRVQRCHLNSSPFKTDEASFFKTDLFVGRHYCVRHAISGWWRVQVYYGLSGPFDKVCLIGTTPK